MFTAIRSRSPCGGPPGGLAGRLAQQPAGDRDELAGLLGHRQEGVGREQPALGVLPAHQRLDALDRAGVQPHDRLVVHDELVDRAVAQPAGHLQPPARGLPQPRREQVHPVAAGRLGGVHRGVGVAEQLVRVARRRARPTATPMLADSGTEMPRAAKGAANGALQPEGERGGLRGVAVGGEDERTGRRRAGRRRPRAARGRPAGCRPRAAAASPTSWPSESLTVLKPSRSRMQQRGTGPRSAGPRAPRRSARAARLRLGRPVRSSCRACQRQRLLGGHPLGDVGVGDDDLPRPGSTRDACSRHQPVEGVQRDSGTRTRRCAGCRRRAPRPAAGGPRPTALGVGRGQPPRHGVQVVVADPAGARSRAGAASRRWRARRGSPSGSGRPRRPARSPRAATPASRSARAATRCGAGRPRGGLRAGGRRRRGR